MSDVFAKNLNSLKLPDFAGELPKLKQLEPPSSLDLLREQGLVGQTGSLRGLDVVGGIIRAEKQRAKEAGVLSPQPLAVPSFADTVAGIQGYEQLPYDRKKALYDAYLKNTLEGLKQQGRKEDPLLLEQKLREQSPAPVDPTGGRGDFARGLIGGYGENTKAAAAGALGFVLDKLGAEDTATALYQRAQEYTKAAQDMGKANDQFTEALKPGGSLTDWAQYNIGQIIGSVGESFVTAGLGALAGGAAGAPAAGVGAAPGAIGGAAFGFFAKSLVKKRILAAISREMKKRVAKEVAEGATEEVARQIARQAADEAIKAAARQQTRRIGAMAAMLGASGARGVGEIIQNAQQEGIDPRTLSSLRVASGAGAYALLETASDKLLLDSIKGIAKGSRIKRTLTRGAAGAVGEGATEVGQDIATGVAAGTGLPTGEQALNAFAAGAVGGGAITGGAALVRGEPAAGGTRTEEQPEPDIDEDTPVDPVGDIPAGTLQEIGPSTLARQADGSWAYAEGSEQSPEADAVIAASQAAVAPVDRDPLVVLSEDPEVLSNELERLYPLIGAGDTDAEQRARDLMAMASDGVLQGADLMSQDENAVSLLATRFGMGDRLLADEGEPLAAESEHLDLTGLPANVQISQPANNRGGQWMLSFDDANGDTHLSTGATFEQARERMLELIQMQSGAQPNTQPPDVPSTIARGIRDSLEAGVLDVTDPGARANLIGNVLNGLPLGAITEEQRARIRERIQRVFMPYLVSGVTAADRPAIQANVREQARAVLAQPASDRGAPAYGNVVADLGRGAQEVWDSGSVDLRQQGMGVFLASSLLGRSSASAITEDQRAAVQAALEQVFENVSESTNGATVAMLVRAAVRDALALTRNNDVPTEIGNGIQEALDSGTVDITQPGARQVVVATLLDRLPQGAITESQRARIVQAVEQLFDAVGSPIDEDTRRVLGARVRANVRSILATPESSAQPAPAASATPTIDLSGRERPVIPGERLPTGAIPRIEPRRRSLLPSEASRVAIGTGNPNMRATQLTSLQWLYQVGSILPGTPARIVTAFDPGDNGRGWSATVQTLNDQGRVTADDPITITEWPTLGELQESLPEPFRVTPQAATSGAQWTPPIQDGSTRPDSPSGTLPLEGSREADFGSVRDAFGALLRFAKSRKRRGLLTRGARRQGALGRLVAADATPEEKEAHFWRALQAGANQLGASLVRNGRTNRNFTIHFPNNGGRAVGTFHAAGAVGERATVSVNTQGFRRNSSVGGRFYDIYNGALVSARIREINSGYTSENVARMPINRLRGFLKWGAITGDFENAADVLNLNHRANATPQESLGAMLNAVLQRVNVRFPSVRLTDNGTSVMTGDGRIISIAELRANAAANTRPTNEELAASPDAVLMAALFNQLRNETTNRGRQARVQAALDNPNLNTLFDLDRALDAERNQPEEAPQETVQTDATLRRIRLMAEAGDLDAALRETEALLDARQRARTQRALRSMLAGRARGADYVRERLYRARRQGLLSSETVEMALWLIDQNPAIADEIAIRIPTSRQGNNAQGVGRYTPAERLVTLFRNATDTTGVHEILHHAERLMPAEVQQGIREEYRRQFDAMFKDADPAVVGDLLTHLARPTNGSWEAVLAHFKSGALNYDQHYQFVNPSEFWAVNATRLMSARYAAQHSWVARAKQWLAELIEKAKGLLGLQSDAPILHGLQEVLNSTGALQPGSKMLAENALNFYDIDNDLPPEGRRVATSTLIDNIANGEPATPSTVPRGVAQSLQRRDYRSAWSQRTKLFEALNRELHDSHISVKRWLQSLPEDAGRVTQQMKQRAIGAMYTARKVRNDLLRRASDLFFNDIDRQIAAFARKHGITLETAQRDLGYAITARYVPEANNKLLLKRTRELIALRQKLEAARQAQTTVELGEGIVPEAEAAAASAPEGQTAVDALQREVALAERKLAELVQAIHNPNTRVRRHGGGGVAGMNNAQAAAMLAGFEQRYGAEGMTALSAVANKLYDHNAWKLALDIETGKVTPEVAAQFLGRPNVTAVLAELRDLANAVDAKDAASVAALEAKRKEAMAAVRSQYVPLSGDPSKDIDDDSFHGGSNIPNVQRDYQLQGRERGVPPDDALSTSRAGIMKSASYAGWRDFQDAIAQLYHAMTPEQRNFAGIEELTLPEGRSLLSRKAVVRFRDGVARAYVFKDESLVDAIKGANRREANVLLESFGKLTKFYAYMATQFNPFFAPFNFLRDSWERNELIRTRHYLRADGSEAPRSAIANGMLQYLLSPELLQATARHAFGRPTLQSTQMGRYLDEFLRQGGVSTFGEQFTADRAKMIAAIQRQTGWRKQFDTLKKYVDNYNKTLDLGPALAAYASMRDQGMSPKDAAAGSLDLMDFGKRGESAAVLGSIYAFAQPTFTGAANAMGSLYDPVRREWNKTGVARFGAYALGFLMLQAFLRSLADDDEGGNKLDQQSGFMKNNFLLIPFGDDGMIKVPLAYGLTRVANGIARAALGIGTNEQTKAEALGNLASGSLLPVFSPIEDNDIDWADHPMHALLTTFAPSWLKPPIAVATNMTPFGSQLVNDAYGDPSKFRSEQFGKYVPEDYRTIAQNLRKLFGIDLAPEEVRYLLRSYPTGAVNIALTGMIDKPEEGVTGAIGRKVYAGYSDFARYFQFKEAIEETDALLKRQNAGEEITDEDERQKLLWRLRWDETDKALRSSKGKATRAATKAGLPKDSINARFADERMAAQVRALYYYRLMQGKPATLSEPEVQVP